MSTSKISLKDTEQKAFQTTFADGLWDVYLGCFISMFAIAPLLSGSLGDFWSSVIFLPVWGVVYLVIRLVRRHVVMPRLGTVTWGSARKGKLRKFSLVMFVVNLAALVLGAIVAINLIHLPGQVVPFILGILLLAGFTLAAYFLNFNRLYVYGLLVGFSPLVGEWLYTYKSVSHHGFPITFGITAVIMILTGLAIFAGFLRHNPIPAVDTSSGEV